jgi:ABC-type nitrate/sulfonate/bicarbonate transport system substrate-binding protein
MLALISTGQVQADVKARVSTPVKAHALYNMPIIAAEEKGFWKTEALVLEYLPFKGGAAMNRAVAAGSLDTGITGGLAVIKSYALGVPMIIVADMKVYNPFFIWVPTQSKLKQPTDLRGTKIGVNRLGGTVHSFGIALAKALGIEKEVRFVGGGGSIPEVAAIKAGHLDGRIGDRFSMAPMKFSGDMRELVAVNEYLPRPWTDVVIFSRAGFAKEQPEAVKKSIKAIMQGADYLQKNRAWTIKKLMSQYGYSEGLAGSIFPNLKYGREGRVDRQALENIKRFLLDFKLIPKAKAPNIEDVYSTKFF